MHWTLIPAKPFGHAKTRLTPVLAPAERAALAETMLRATVAATRAADADGGVMIVSYPGMNRKLAQAIGADRLFISDRAELNAQLNEASLDVPATDSLLVLHADLPLVAASDIAAMLATDDAVVLAADRAGTGTNALLLRGGRRFFRFGADSFALHRAEAVRRRAGVGYVVRPGLAFDLDTPKDWNDLPSGYRSALTAHDC